MKCLLDELETCLTIPYYGCRCQSVLCHMTEPCDNRHLSLFMKSIKTPQPPPDPTPSLLKLQEINMCTFQTAGNSNSQPHVSCCFCLLCYPNKTERRSKRTQTHTPV